MSYNVSIKRPTGHVCNCDQCDLGYEEVYWSNYTSNCSGMWARALGFPLRDLAGKGTAEVAEHLARAVAAFEADPETYRDLNPENGWGDADRTFIWLNELRLACVEYPNETLSICS